MAVIAQGQADQFTRKPDARFAIILLYGPDHGLIVERGAALAAAITGGSDDPMQILRLEGEAVVADPLKLADEANTMSMFGGRRAIRLRAQSLRGGAKSLVPALQTLVDTPPVDAVVIVEADDLTKKDALLALCSEAKSAAAIACYGDNARNLTDIVAGALRDSGKIMDADSRQHLLTLLGGDRIASRAEIDKLLLYVGDAQRIGIDDIEASVGDSAGAMVDTALDGAFAGDVNVMMAALGRLKAEGADANMLLLRLLSHAWRLAQVLETIGTKGKNDFNWKLISGSFTRKPLIEKQLATWKPEDVMKQIRTIGEAVETARMTARLADAAVDRTFLGIALAARRKSKR